MTPALADICESLDVRVVPNKRSRTRGPGETCALQKLEDILSEHGPGHLTIVLKSFTETENNSLLLVGPVIEAVSRTILDHPEWTATTAWFDAMDQANLARMWSIAKANKHVAKRACAVATLLFVYLTGIFAAEPQGELL